MEEIEDQDLHSPTNPGIGSPDSVTILREDEEPEPSKASPGYDTLPYKMQGPSPDHDYDHHEDKFFDSHVVQRPEDFPGATPNTNDDLTGFRAAVAAVMMPPVATSSIPPPPNAQKVTLAEITIPVGHVDRPSISTAEVEKEPPPTEELISVITPRFRHGIVTMICYGLGVIGAIAIIGALYATRKPPTPIVVHPMVCVLPELRSNLPTEAQNYYFPCHRGGPAMFYCSVTAAPAAEERGHFCRTIWAACAPPIGQSVLLSKQEACLADPYAHPINH